MYLINSIYIDNAKNSIPFNAIESLSFLYAISNIIIVIIKNAKLVISTYSVSVSELNFVYIVFWQSPGNNSNYSFYQIK